MKNLRNKFIMDISVAALLLVGVSNAEAQKVELGVRFMPTFSSMEFKTYSGGTIKGKATFSYGAGAFIGFNLTNHFGVQGEVLYSSISQKYTEQDIERKINLKYINVPILLSLNTSKAAKVNLNVVAGPQMGISVGSTVQTTAAEGTSTIEAVLAVKKGDLGVAYGAGLDFGLTSSVRFSVGFRGVFGLIDISDNSKSITTNSYYILDRTHIKTYSTYLGVSIQF